jgi:hypothetical protein
MVMTHRLALRALTLSALSAFSALSVPAQSGVLVGVSKLVGHETLWIVGDSTRPIRATIPDLLVPRPDGWWRVGTTPICLTGVIEGQGMEILWRAPADSSPVISEFCHEVRRGDLPVPISAIDSVMKDSLSRELIRCSWSSVRVRFVSAEHIAVGEKSGQTHECEPGGGRWYQSYYVSRFNGDSSLALAQFAGAGADSLSRAALTRAAQDLARGGVCTKAAESFDPRDLADVGWYPSRATGRWIPILFTQLRPPECQLTATVDVGLSNALIGYDSLRQPSNVMVRGVKGLLDAFSSPRGDLVIARVPDSLIVFVGAGDQLGGRLGAVPFVEREIVMIQWATGRDVVRWNEEIVAMLRRGLPGPKVVPPAKGP